MSERGRGLFAGRGIHLPPMKITALTVLIAFVAGMLIGWGTTKLPSFVQAVTAPTASPTPTVVAQPTPDVEVSVPPLSPITRELNDEDIRAGLTTLEYVYQGEGTFTVVPGSTTPDPDGPPVRWVSIEVEDGIGIAPRAFSTFVMTALNDPRGWGANNRLQYARTDGVADIRIVIASPYTAAAMCPNPYTAAPVPAADAEVEPELAASPTPGVTPEPSALPCAERSIMALSLYDWAAGIDTYEEERTRSRVYLLMHHLGYLMGQEQAICANGRALVMADQRELSDDCTVNHWPNPDAPRAEE